MLKKITQSFLTLLLLMVAGVAYGQKPTEVANLSKDMYHKWTGVDGSAAIAEPDEANCDFVLGSATGCAYGNSNINISTSTQYADLGEWDYLTIVVAADNPRLFFNQNDVADQGGNILVPVSDANYVVSNENGVIVYDLAKFKADKGFVHLNSIKASAYNTQVNITEMKLAKGAPYIPVEQKIADLDKSLYHKWTGVDGSAAIADPDDANCDYVLNSATGCAYGNSNINISTSTQYADLGEWDYLTIVVAADNPRLFFNQNDVADQGGNILVPVSDANYVVSNENGVIVYDLAKFKADKGFVHLNAIKASAYNTQVNIEEMKLATGEAYIPATKYDITIADGIENGTVAVKDGLKKAAEGDKVTLTITPAEGYELDALSVLAGETAVQVATDNTFTMPAAAVTVSATFKEKQGGEEQGTEAKVADLAIDMFHKWTGFDAEATVADPDENGGAINLDAETDCPYGNTNVTEFEYADLSAWDYLTVVLNTDDQPRLFLNSKGGNDRIQVNTNDANYVVSNEDGVIVYDLAAIKAAAGFVHLNSIKASSWNTKANVAEMKLATVKPYIPVKAEVADLAADMFHKWTGFDAEATVADPDENGGAVNLDAETDCPYGNTNVTEYEYADLSAWDYLTLVVKSDNPRLFFNSKGGNDRITVLVNDEKYVKSNENGVIVYDLAAIKADGGFVHLNSIKASAWNTKTIVTEMKLATVEPYIPVVAETYAITITEAENGSVSANVTEAAEGAKVTLTITPAEGYELDALSVAAGETPVEVADDNTFTMPAAAVTVTATFKAVESGEEEYLPKPETDPDYADFEEIAQDQGKDLDTFARTAVEEGADFNTYTASGDLQVAFKMYDIDVKDCDYVTVKFAQPAPKGWNIAFWAQGGTDNVEIPEGATEYKYVFADDAKCAIKDDVLPQICVLTLWPGGYPFDMKVYGIYKHKATANAIEGVETAEDAVKDGKYFINGQIVIVKNGVKYNAAGVAIK